MVRNPYGPWASYEWPSSVSLESADLKNLGGHDHSSRSRLLIFFLTGPPIHSGQDQEERE